MIMMYNKTIFFISLFFISGNLLQAGTLSDNSIVKQKTIPPSPLTNKQIKDRVSFEVEKWYLNKNKQTDLRNALIKNSNFSHLKVSNEHNKLINKVTYINPNKQKSISNTTNKIDIKSDAKKSKHRHFFYKGHLQKTKTFKDYIKEIDNTSNVKELFLIGNKALKSNQLIIALKAFQKLLLTDNPHGYYGKGILFLTLGNNKRGLKLLETASNKGFAMANMYLADYYFEKRDYSKVKKYLNKILKAKDKKKLYGMVYYKLSVVELEEANSVKSEHSVENKIERALFLLNKAIRYGNNDARELLEHIITTIKKEGNNEDTHK